MIRLVVTDMDNTLYSWTDYIVPAVEAMVDVVCRATHLPRIRVVQSLKAVYTKYESNEYPFALQESSLFAELPDFGSFDALLISPARAAFNHARKKYLRPYPHVMNTLETLKARDLPVVALTDAPRNPAEQRVKKLGIDRYLTALYTLPGFDFPRNPEGKTLIAQDILRRDERGEYKAACRVVELARDHEKPNPAGLLRICQDLGIPPDQTLVVGDSVKKDVAVAKAVGALDCWAEYGTYVSHEYRERLDTISADAITRRHAAGLLQGDSSAAQPTHALSNFGRLLPLLG